ncbi:MAG: hypothetical protein COB05_05405 [Marinobacter sp.]|nr:MAG: hypothetical protein COB05_05405 [Marinobacter sp.]
MLIEIPKTVSTHAARAGLQEIRRHGRVVISQQGRFIELSDETPFCLMYPLAEFMKCNLRLGRDGCSLKFVEQARAQVIPFPASQPTPPGAA